MDADSRQFLNSADTPGAAVLPTVTPSPIASARSDASILVVDDEAALRGIIGLSLRHAGYRVIEAGNGAEAAKALESGIPDLVITDIIMPGMDGIETVMQLRQRAPGIPIIAMSGGGSYFDSGNILRAATLLGAQHVLAKPFTMAELLTTIQTQLDRRPRL